MRKYSFLLGLLGAFLIGTALPVFAASYPGDYVKVTGHSTSCAMGRASVNDSTYKTGSKTSNFRGCSPTNAHRNVPSGYLGAQAVVRNYNSGAVCGTSARKSNSTSTWTIEQTAKIVVGAAGCPGPGYYLGQSFSYRKLDSGGTVVGSEIYSPRRWINLYYV